MEDWVKVVNAIIEKAGITSVVIAIMASIVFYRLILEDTLWAIVVGGVSYVLLLGAIKLVASTTSLTLVSGLSLPQKVVILRALVLLSHTRYLHIIWQVTL
jgi:hypothetical protein